jgi:hypothetical protein
MADPVYRVDSFHVNVLAGDAAFHVLLQIVPEQDEPSVLSAVIFDGGHNRFHGPTGSVGNLKTTLTTMQSMYRWQGSLDNEWGDLTRVRFDAMVISHWDEDHFLGILECIQEALDHDYPDEENLLKGQVSIFRYVTSDDQINPRTRVYSPNWVGVKVPVGGKKQASPKTLYFVRTTIPEEVDLLNIYSHRINNVAHRNSDMKANGVAWNYEGPKNVLGVDFFTGKSILKPAPGQPSVLKPSAIKNVQAIISSTRIDNYQNGNKPGLFCIACRGQYLGPGVPALEADPEIVAEPELALEVEEDAEASGQFSTFRRPPIRVVDKSTGSLSPTNHSSIAAIVVSFMSVSR